MIAKDINIQFTEQKEIQLILTVDEAPDDINELKEAINKGKTLTVEIKQLKKGRSLNANAYLWVLLGKIAKVLHTTKDELYLLMLQRYGVFTHIIVSEDAVERVKETWRTVIVLGQGVVGGKKGVQLQCYFGSSTYDTKEMSSLLEGVIDEAKGIGIQVLSEREKTLLMEAWENENNII